jgi:bifunctional UDP-N-acetylglucosamine pyrophosphorylase/glucosamine-1-phosphate N-acetyltransferase
VNGGIYALPCKKIFPLLKMVKNTNKQKEFYLTDAINILAENQKIESVPIDSQELFGLNTRTDLSLLQNYAKNRVNSRWLKSGVTILDPSTTFIGPRVKIGSDVLIEPNVTLIGAVTIGTGSIIQAGSRIEDSKIGNHTVIKPYTLIDRSVLTNHVVVGPFARLREGTELSDHVQIGNFVETKKAKISKGSKANHLTYLGDVSIGTNSNIGAGVITCNYDGLKKHKTVIGDNVFIGSDTQIIAPIKVGDGTLVAAGTTVTVDIPSHHKAKSRVPQVNRPLKKAKK